MTAHLQQILFAFSGKAAYEQFIAMADKIRCTGDFAPVFWSPNSGDRVFIQDAENRGFGVFGKKLTQQTEIINSLGDRGFSAFHNISFYRLLQKIPGIWSAKQIIIALMEARGFKNKRSRISRELWKSNVVCCIFSDVRASIFLPMACEAYRGGTPVFLLPANYLCLPDGGATMRRNNRELRTQTSWKEAFAAGEVELAIFNRIVSKLFPQQVFSSVWGAMLCYPAREILALHFAGLLTKNLWYQGTSFVSKIVISGDDEARVCKVAGISDEKVVKLGSPVFEIVREKWIARRKIRADLAEQYKFSSNCKILIFAIPVGWEHKMITKAQQFDVLETVFCALTSDTTFPQNKRPVVLVSLHPKSNRADYIEISSRYGAHIVDRPLSDIIGIADMFIAGAYSSTIRWALSLSIPSINIDFWEINETTYDHFDDFKTVKTQPEIVDWCGNSIEMLSSDEQLPQTPLGICAAKGFYERMEENIISEIKK